ncbi:uncharacterized protein BO95DRAFT_137846 [Aspergillus brunneoviolaceus CBS 621.78]|uniref:Uncharacterized protein n=1 Tax=Aspergillus brunneoviolaceus CBS 621.78 TaxID=1450534 RepID=A0ACD1G8T0_9EURO|nr:hypothetical protein BO95DRAFT_137846 [Aspergillus brunneoviolaceus CBS 621.78]RAH45625.1 hypothetical protein BO95DRAFT_137846 [Aspergillus brunneoviolaceus CBS 621.78]
MAARAASAETCNHSATIPQPAEWAEEVERFASPRGICSVSNSRVKSGQVDQYSWGHLADVSKDPFIITYNHLRNARRRLAAAFQQGPRFCSAGFELCPFCLLEVEGKTTQANRATCQVSILRPSKEVSLPLHTFYVQDRLLGWRSSSKHRTQLERSAR